jgi:hypothetical protein
MLPLEVRLSIYEYMSDNPIDPLILHDHDVSGYISTIGGAKFKWQGNEMLRLKRDCARCRYSIACCNKAMPPFVDYYEVYKILMAYEKSEALLMLLNFVRFKIPGNVGPSCIEISSHREMPEHDKDNQARTFIGSFGD